VKAWLYRRIVEPLLTLLKQGISPHRLALAWILVAPFAVFLFYKLLTPVFEHAAARVRFTRP
jgi:hypothetical protein